MQNFLPAKIYLTLFFLVFSCSTSRTFYFDAAIISMKKSDMPKKAQLKQTGPVKEKWCGKDPLIKGGEKAFVDQVVLKAHKTAKVDYILDAQFYWIDRECMELKGTGANLAGVSQKRRKKR